jgi:hypothetical protein
MYFTLTRFGFSKSIFFFCIFCSVITEGQIDQVNRVEIPLLAGESNYFKVAVFKEKGLVLYKTLLEPEANYIELQKLDTALKEQWKGFITINKNLSFVKAKTKESLLVFLFRNRNAINGNYQAIIVNESKGGYITYDIDNAIPFNSTDFEVTGNSLIIGGYLNLRPIMLHYSLITKKTKVLPGYFNEQGEITQVKTYPNGEFDIMVRARNNEKRKSLWLRSYDADGNLLNTTTVASERNKNFLHGKSVRLSNGKQLLAGTYGRYSEYSQGIFLALIDSPAKPIINYYPYSDLKHFFGFMKARREDRIKKRIERRKAKGQRIKFNYKFVLHDLIPAGNQVILTAESYFPRYTYATYSPRSNFLPTLGTNPYQINNQSYRGDYIFDGFQYTHAVVLGFDRNATLLWDNSFEINDINNMQLEQFVKVVPQQKQANLYYLFENTLRTKIIQDSTVLEPKKSTLIKALNPLEESVKKDGEANALELWYDDYFIASGVQKLRNSKQGRFSPERRVFYLNKIKHN